MRNFTDITFRRLLDALMFNDPAPNKIEHKALTDLIDIEAINRGYTSWVEAYHEFDVDLNTPLPQLPFNKEFQC